MRVDRRRNNLLVADGLIDPSLSALITDEVDRATFEEQQLGSRMYRHRERAVIESPEIAAALWELLAPHIGRLEDWISAASVKGWPSPLSEWEPVGCNPRSRVYRYLPGTNFAVHRDIPWMPDEATRSVLTVLVYLPLVDCVGGVTRFGDDELIEPIDWRIAVFDHEVPHEGLPVERGEKRVLRSDIIAHWTKQPPPGPTL